VHDSKQEAQGDHNIDQQSTETSLSSAPSKIIKFVIYPYSAFHAIEEMDNRDKAISM